MKQAEPTTNDLKLTDNQIRALRLLRENGLYPYEFYKLFWPNSPYTTGERRDTGSSKGGPSKMEYAANNYLGKLQKLKLVYRFYYIRDGDNSRNLLFGGKWVLTQEGLLYLVNRDRGIARCK